MSQITVKGKITSVFRVEPRRKWGPTPKATIYTRELYLGAITLHFEKGNPPADWVEGQAVEIIIRSVTP